MKKNIMVTPKGRIRSALRKLFLTSRERSYAIKRDSYSCVLCGAKQSKAKGKEVSVEVHHREGIDWEGITAMIQERILQTPDRLETLCVECHKLKEKLP